ncbi:MAG TPA: DUF1990 family protein [Thermoanaerobaculia bacterium]|nr:DUF1990 family protein [Thermoanaerobaculia bacterium]
MNVLVTGGTGVIGEGVIPELIARGHHVRLLSRHADEDAQEWDGVEPFRGDIGDPQSIRGAADGIDVVMHIAGIVAEDPPEVTFESVNVGGTRNMLREALRGGAKRFVFVSSLGADIGQSDYHRSKREAEALVKNTPLPWVIVRPGNVYGPGDEVISTILKLVRALPAIPTIDDGRQQFQPIWHEDLARILAAVAEREELREEILEAAGADVTNMRELVEKFGEITGRSPVRIPVPLPLAQWTSRLASMLVEFPVDDNKLTMLEEQNVVRNRDAAQLLGIPTMPLDEGLRKLADALKEALPEEGFGSLQHKTFFADIRGSRQHAASLMTHFREHVNDFMAIEFVAEPGAPDRIEQGATMTGSLPLRGNFQVRVEVAEPTHIVLATIEGHPLSGIVEFRAQEHDGALRFSIETWTRASNVLDWLAVRTVGAAAQDANWRKVIERIIEVSGGTAAGVQQEKETLSDEEAARVEERVRNLVRERKRGER